MTTALVLGGADTLSDDIARYDGPIDGVVACNEAGTVWSGRLDAWVTLHPTYFTSRQWLDARALRGFHPAQRLFTLDVDHVGVFPDVEKTSIAFPGEDPSQSGSSGLFAAKVALIDLGFDRAVLCGIPMTASPHFSGRDTWCGGDRSPVHGFRRAWEHLKQPYRNRIRSMSGWTRLKFGAPHRRDEEWTDQPGSIG